MSLHFLRSSSLLQIPRRFLKTYSPTNPNQLERILQSWSSKVPVERALTLPSGFYTSRDVFELERYAIFGQNWLYAGRKDQVYKSGDYLTDQFLSEPYLINVDAAGNLHGHYNVCCHHGMRLLEEHQGHIDSNEIVCPYHGWVYDLSGRLKKALRLKSIQEFKASKVHLKPIAIETIGPFIYLNFNFSNHTNIDDSGLSSIKQIHTKYLQSTNYDRLTFITRESYPIKCNWKIFVDNYLDGGYHVPYAHKQLHSILNMTEYKVSIENNKSSVQHCTGTQRTEGHVVFAYIYPNFMINRYGPYMDTNIVVPIDEQNCIVHMDYYYDPRTTTQQLEENERNDSRRVQKEDIYLCENVQLGLQSNAYDTGRYVPTVEHGMHSFHQTLFNELEHYYRNYTK
ncbi:unnamed protein product [Adineta ricciae]|uniref:Choline monooxygenase, chloroplastic n=1 Tax=Adineta ricciae TaxID=249248 RepID=A0A814INA0_ADIRI|nr:unnamed protein product [Adineta ricciae]